MQRQSKATPDSPFESDEFPLRGYAREQLAGAIAAAEKKWRALKPPNVFVAMGRLEQRSPAELEEHKQQQKREREEDNLVTSARCLYLI
jgi:hypothetical protein